MEAGGDAGESKKLSGAAVSLSGGRACSRFVETARRRRLEVKLGYGLGAFGVRA